MMGFAYHFVALDEEQQKRRRQLLDGYGQFAQFSILLIPLIYQLCLGLRLIVARLWKKDDQPVKDRHSPVLLRSKHPATSYSTNFFARLRWFLDGEVIRGWGTWQEWFIAGLWTMWLLALVVKDTADGVYTSVFMIP